MLIVINDNECGLDICIYVKCNETTFAINMCINEFDFDLILSSFG